MKVYFIADLHFGHRKIIGFDNRPWDSLQSMEAEMIRRWNERVTDRDHVFIVGDFCAFSSMSHAAAILRRLKGHKHLIRGNHDLREPVFDSFFEDVSDYRQITVRAFGEKQNLVLCHYFRPFFRGARQGGIHLYGHTHNSRVAEMDMHIDEARSYNKTGSIKNFHFAGYGNIFFNFSDNPVFDEDICDFMLFSGRIDHRAVFN